MNSSDEARAALERALLEDSEVEFISETGSGQSNQTKLGQETETMKAALRWRWDRAKAKGFRGSFLPSGV